MKIRHKQSGVELEGEFEVTDTDFMENSDGRWQATSCYSKAQWEEVKPKWVDVTEACEAHCMNRIIHNGQTIDGPTGYRLRKIKMLRAYAPPAGFSSPQYEPVDAFIIEQRQA